jgi:hypothetical protein
VLLNYSTVVFLTFRQSLCLPYLAGYISDFKIFQLKLLSNISSDLQRDFYSKWETLQISNCAEALQSPDTSSSYRETEDQGRVMICPRFHST